MPYGGPPEEPWIDPMTGLPANEESLRGIGNMAYGILNMPADLAKRATESAGSLQQGGSYDAGPAVDTVLMGVGGTPKVSGAAGIFGGRLSKTADLSMLAKAEEMHAAGAPAESIWNQTGWFRGAEGKWRYEIPDQASAMQPMDRIHGPSWNNEAASRPAELRSGPLEETISHPEAYAAYPQLKNIENFTEVHPGAATRGTYTPGEGPEIYASADTLEQARNVLLHEMQHGVQHIEGFATGGSPTNIPLTNRELGDLTKTALRRAEGVKPWSRRNAGERDDALKAARQYSYEMIAGETEARNVQARRDFVNRQVPPWKTEDVPRESQIVRYADESGTNARRAGQQAYEPAPGPSAKFPQYAEEYPPVAPGALQVDKKTGKEFMGKGDTPETKAFEKERARISGEMKQGYEPYFNPDERFYVDASKYPERNVDTLTLKPERQATIDKYLEQINAPQTREALRKAYEKGTALGNANDWYAMGQLEKVYIKEFGAKAGRQRFMDEFAVPMAATTSGNNPPANFLMAQYLEYLRKNKMPMPTASHEMPVTVGGRRAMTNVENYQQVRERGGYAGLGADQPKMHNFARSFMGDLSRGVMDEQMTAGMLAHVKDPKFADNARKSAFGLLEKPLHEEAALAAPPGARAAGAAPGKGVQPGNYQDVAWAGFKGESAGPMVNVINDAIERTHRLTGMPREEIVKRGLLRKEIPMYAFGALAPIGMLANQSNKEF